MRVRAKCILLVRVIWDKEQETLKHEVIKVFLPPKSDTVVNVAESCEQRVYTCTCACLCARVFIETIEYLSCNSSLQTPVVASGQVCGCPKLP